jgi:anti-anti-sigma factor
MMHRRQHKARHTPGFEMHEQRDERGTVRLSLSGELDLAVAHLLRSRLQQLAHTHATVTLDLSDLQLIKSTGLDTHHQLRRSHPQRVAAADRS